MTLLFSISAEVLLISGLKKARALKYPVKALQPNAHLVAHPCDPSLPGACVMLALPRASYNYGS